MNNDSLHQGFVERNRQTSGNWTSFQSHRERIKRLLTERVPGRARSICVLGAGNGNDLDLAWLVERFEKVVLVDLDLAAVKGAVDRQLGNTPASLDLVELDMTGSLAALSELARNPAGRTPDTIAGLHENLADVPAPRALGQVFDCVLSTCLLSQLIDSVKSAVGEGHSGFLPLVQQVRQQHLATIAQLTDRQGLGVVVFDFVSSVTCPELVSIPEASLQHYGRQQVARRNFFTGLNPAIVRKTFGQALGAAEHPSAVELIPPWRWDLGPRTYLVTAALGGAI